MPTYELGLVLTPELEGEERDAFLGEVRQLIAGAGGEILKEDDWGKRSLAYPINHKRDGFYTFWTFLAPGTVVAPLEYKLRISDHVLRHLVLNMDRELRRSHKMERVRTARKVKKAAVSPPALAAAMAEGE